MAFLGFELEFSDLFTPTGLRALQAMFEHDLKLAEPALYQEYVDYLSFAHPYTHPEESELLLKVAPHVQEFAIRLVMATQPEQDEAHPMAKKYIRYGSSPRGAQGLVECGRVRALFQGRFHLAVEDILHVAPAVLRHRIILNFDAHADGQTPETILSAVIKGVTSQASVA